MTQEKFLRAKEIKNDIRVLEMINSPFEMSMQTMNEFVTWKNGMIKKLQDEFNQL